MSPDFLLIKFLLVISLSSPGALTHLNRCRLPRTILWTTECPPELIRGIVYMIAAAGIEPGTPAGEQGVLTVRLSDRDISCT